VPQGYCYAIRDFSALLPQDVDIDALGTRRCNPPPPNRPPPSSTHTPSTKGKRLASAAPCALVLLLLPSWRRRQARVACAQLPRPAPWRPPFANILLFHTTLYHILYSSTVHYTILYYTILYHVIYYTIVYAETPLRQYNTILPYTVLP